MKKTVILLLSIFISISVFAKENVVMLRQDGVLRSDNGQGGVEWAMSIPAGTVLELESNEPELKILITSTDSFPDIEFYKVTYMKKTYYARKSEVAIGTPGVILENTLMYTTPALSSFLNTDLELGTIVVLGPSFTTNSVNFQEVYYYSDNAGVIRKRYVRKSFVSPEKKDVEAIQLLNKALTIKDDPESKSKFLENAARTSYSEEILMYIIENEKNN